MSVPTVSNSGLGSRDVVVEYNEMEEEEERMAWFLEGGCLYIYTSC